jgi:hypothetical protein
MRMWLVDPKLMCNQHLLGEHVEMHAFIGTIKKGISIKGYITKGLVEPEKIQERHNILASEMEARGMHHNSPMFTNITFWNGDKGRVDASQNIQELMNRCPKCKIRIQQHAIEMIQEARAVFKAIVPKNAIMADTDGYYIIKDGKLTRIDFQQTGEII